MRALLVFGVLALAGNAYAVPFADHGAVGVSTAKRAVRTRVVRLLDPATALDRSTVLSGPPSARTIVRANPQHPRTLAIFDLSASPSKAAGFHMPSALKTAVSMVRVSPSSGALRITF